MDQEEEPEHRRTEHRDYPPDSLLFALWRRRDPEAFPRPPLVQAQRGGV